MGRWALIAALAACGGTNTVTRVEVRTTHGAHEEATPTQTVTTATLPPGIRVPLGSMVQIPATTARVGATDMRYLGHPVRQVTLPAFEIDVTEVTVGAYQACIDLGVCTPPERGERCNYGMSGREEHPANCVSAEQAMTYCRFVHKRLPTEDEWEVAARGVDFRLFPWGNDEPGRDVCWNRYVRGSTCRVGQSTQDISAFGVRDMGGNLMEWTATQACTNGECSTGRATGPFMVYRGGSWGLRLPRDLRTARRHVVQAHQQTSSIGFRCAR